MASNLISQSLCMYNVGEWNEKSITLDVILGGFQLSRLQLVKFEANFVKAKNQGRRRINSLLQCSQ